MSLATNYGVAVLVFLCFLVSQITLYLQWSRAGGTNTRGGARRTLYHQNRGTLYVTPSLSFQPVVGGVAVGSSRQQPGRFAHPHTRGTATHPRRPTSLVVAGRRHHTAIIVPLHLWTPPIHVGEDLLAPAALVLTLFAGWIKEINRSAVLHRAGTSKHGMVTRVGLLAGAPFGCSCAIFD